MAIRITSPLGNASFGDAFSQRRSLDEFHHDCLDATGIFYAVESRDVGMVQRGKGSRLVLETCDTIGVLRHRRWEHLDSDLAFQFYIPRQVHISHAARADEGDDFERIDVLSGQVGGDAAYRRLRSSRVEKTLTAARSRSRNVIPDVFPCVLVIFR